MGSDVDYIGFMALNPVDQTQLVFSSDEGLFEINQATSCSGSACDPTNLTLPMNMPTKLGPVAFDQTGSYLVVSSRVKNANDNAEIWVADDVTDLEDLDPKVEDDPIFNSAAFALTDMAITDNGDVFLSSRGQGVIVISGAVP